MFTVEYNVSFGFVIYVLYYTEVCSFYTLHVEGFIIKECHTLSNVLWTSIEEIIMLFHTSFYLSLHHRNKSHLILVYNSLNVFLNLAFDICWEFLHQYSVWILTLVLSSCNFLIYLVSRSWWWPCRMGLEMFLPSSLIFKIFLKNWHEFFYHIS